MTTTAWRSRAAHQVGVLHVFPGPVLAFIESLLINEEAEKLDRRLGTVFLSRGHVDVIHKDSDAFLFDGGTESVSVKL